MTKHPDPGPACAIRVLLVDDHALVRDWLRTLIEREPGLSVCGCAATAAETREAIRGLEPDLIVLDLSLSDCDGTRLIHEIAAGPRPIRVLVLSSYDEAVYAKRCLSAADDIRRAIRAVAGGRVFVSDTTVAHHAPMPAARMGRASDDFGPGDLSDRELELFQLLGRGFGPSKAAGAMGLSIKTVEGYEARIRVKLGLESAGELGRFAVSWYRAADR
jgi:DNA-binding NarL/FixJ family response regulator